MCSYTQRWSQRNRTTAIVFFSNLQICLNSPYNCNKTFHVSCKNSRKRCKHSEDAFCFPRMLIRKSILTCLGQHIPDEPADLQTLNFQRHQTFQGPSNKIFLPLSINMPRSSNSTPSSFSICSFRLTLMSDGDMVLTFLICSPLLLRLVFDW